MIEEERWQMHGLDSKDPACLHTVEEVENYIEEVGFLPFFRNEIKGFSVEEHTASTAWWTGDPATDPWEWRGMLASRGRLIYGKFFNRAAGFISKKWFPAFANYRRDGYDFDAAWDDELASRKAKKIMDLFADDRMDREILSPDLKEFAGYGKNGEKNFDGEITNLQMQTYLCIHDFKRRKSKAGKEYGWGVAQYCTPEHLFGYEHVSSLYNEDPAESALRILRHALEIYPRICPGSQKSPAIIPDVDLWSFLKILGIRIKSTGFEPDRGANHISNRVASQTSSSVTSQTSSLGAGAACNIKASFIADFNDTEAQAPRKPKKEIPYPDNLIRALKIEGLKAETMTDDQKAGLEVAIGQLRDKQQRTINMKFRDHMTNEQIGKALRRSPGTIGTYRTKAIGKLKWPDISAWYLEGYDAAIETYLQRRGLKKGVDYPAKTIRDDNPKVSGRDFCLRLGISFKQFDALMTAGIRTVFDLILVMQDEDWYRPLRGIGPKGAAEIEKKLDERYFM